MNQNHDIRLRSIFSAFKGRITITWLFVLIETIGLALIPLAMGIAIDGLLDGRPMALLWLAGLLVSLTISSVIRRVYDTRVYGHIRVKLGIVLASQQSDTDLSNKNARLDMSRELVDFLEEELPNLITSIVQIAITLIVLAAYDTRLALSALCMTCATLLIYWAFHISLYTCNAQFNSQMEKQVSVLSTRKTKPLLAHLLSLKKWEIRISDREAIMYGVFFLAVTGFVIYNLWISASLPNMSAGRLFTILSYTWDYVEAAIALPTTLLFFTRIREITQRLALRNEAQE